MQVVGDKLRDCAMAAKDEGAIDKFGRSAFNRYYYATFLIVRAALMEIDPKWAHCPHAKLPELLQKTLVRSARKQAKKLERTGLLNAKARRSLINSIQACAGDLAELMKLSYAVRCIADYKPEVRVELRGGNLYLDQWTSRNAEEWAKRASRNAGQLQAKWKDLGN